ncbi:MAG TPA: hypothetical protein VGH50_17355 [Candidatus Binatia bacterium]|jgi:hypothetical protein
MQVLAGLGALSALTLGFLVWLQKLQPLFFAAAAAGLVYQVYLVWNRPPQLRSRAMKVVLAASFAVNGLVLVGWFVWFRFL